MDYIVGQRFGNREIVRSSCVDSDWLDLGLRLPPHKEKYVLTKCLNCGTVIPCMHRNLRYTPPKRCVLCSNIGNHSKVKTFTNSWIIDGDTAVCNVEYGGQIVSVYIDASDYDKVSKYTWRIAKKRQKYYVVTGSFKLGTMVYMHRLVLGDSVEISEGMEIDHIDGNSLNNRRSNLRIVSRQENIDNQIATRIDNQIGIRGVSYSKRDKTYKVDFNYHGTRFYTRSWKTLPETVWCRKCFEDYFGINALANNPLAEQYYTLSEVERESIRQYVLNVINTRKRAVA